MHRSLISIAFLSICVSGCTTGKMYSPDSVSLDSPHLEDCTEQISEYFERDVPQIPTALRQEALIAASAWAYDNCYIPCSYKMCGTITEYDGNSVSVYVSYEMEDLSADPDTGEVYIRIGPEAEVTFDSKTFRVEGEAMWHSGCRWDEDICAFNNGP